ncbi:MAG: hypothetical protein AAGG72_06135 [Pseudomonadota bacterium]
MFLSIAPLIVCLSIVVLGLGALTRMRAPKRQQASAAPDGPLPFGEDTAWLALRTDNTIEVVDALQLNEPRTVTWQDGLAAALEQSSEATGEVFVTPPVSGWTFVVGLALPLQMGRSFSDPLSPLMVGLSRRFDDVQYFVNCPELDYFAWQRMRSGQAMRIFAATDDGIVTNRGMPTFEERALGMTMFELRGVRDRQGDAGGELLLHPTSQHVLKLAAVWGLDPTRLSSRDAAPGLGYVGGAPRGWKATLKKATAAA